jgi:ABC-2 type transport system ATP-binding protein
MDARDHTTDIRCNLGYVSQQLSIEPALTGRHNVEWFARLCGVPRCWRANRVDEAVCAMQLLDVAGRLAAIYSGGMVRRLEIAQALVNRPLLLVLDEPTVGLDPIARDGVWTRVRDIQAQFGMTVLLTTHYMEEAEALRDRVARMHHGALRIVGTPSELKSTMSPDATLEDVFRYYVALDLADRTPSQNLREIHATTTVDRRFYRWFPTRRAAPTARHATRMRGGHHCVRSRRDIPRHRVQRRMDARQRCVQP